MPRRAGFTVVEVMVVLLLIGIIAVIAYPTLTGAKKDSRDAPARAELQAGYEGVQDYYQDNSSYSGMTAANATNYDSGHTWTTSAPLSPSNSANPQQIKIEVANGVNLTLCNAGSTKVFCVADTGNKVTYGAAASEAQATTNATSPSCAGSNLAQAEQLARTAPCGSFSG